MAGLVWQSRRMTANKHQNVGIAPDGVKIREAMNRVCWIVWKRPLIRLRHLLPHKKRGGEGRSIGKAWDFILSARAARAVGMTTLLLAAPVQAVTLDRTASVIDQQVLT